MLLLFSILVLSCSKDSDLFTDVVEEQLVNEGTEVSPNGFQPVDDEYTINAVNTAFLLEVLNNDNIPENVVVGIVQTTAPEDGELTINDNNVLSYTPTLFDNKGNGDIVTDTFTYTVEITSNGQTEQKAATVVVNTKYSDSSTKDMGKLKAFPSAYGAASQATGGRGYAVYKVTNLNDSGTGSFRDAVSTSNRTIVFDVSGTIELTTPLTISADNLTIAGQTTPPGGIDITGNNVYFDGANNVIVRFLRFRPNYNNSGNVDALNVSNCDDLIIDHCSISWGGDEALSIIGDSDNVTISNNIFAESSTGMLAGDSNSHISSNISIHNNLWYNISHRFPNVNVTRADVINNLVHNWYTRIMVISKYDNIQLNEIANYYQRGSRPTNVLDVTQHSGNWLDVNSSRENMRVYTEGNVINDVLSEGEDNWALYRYRFDISSGTYSGASQWDAASIDFRSLTQYTLLGDALPFTSAIEAKSEVETNSGAYKTLNESGTVTEDWDAIDDRYLGYVNTNTFDYTPVYPADAITGRTHYIEYHSAVSSTPINTRSESYDTDKDGMPDVWEVATFGDLMRNGTGDFDGDGYTDLEAYLNLVDF